MTFNLLILELEGVFSRQFIWKDYKQVLRWMVSMLVSSDGLFLRPFEVLDGYRCDQI